MSAVVEPMVTGPRRAAPTLFIAQRVRRVAEPRREIRGSVLFALSSLLFLFGCSYLVRRIYRVGSPEQARAFETFLERTGYGIDGYERLPRGEQVRLALSESFTTRPYVRELAGGRLSYVQWVMSCEDSTDAPDSPDAPRDRPGWVLRLREPVRVRWSVAPKRSLMAALLRSDGEGEPWRPDYPRVGGGRFGLDSHDLYTTDAEALARVLDEPGLVEALERCAYLELHVLGDAVVLVDPRMELIRGESGGNVAMMAVAADPERSMDLSAMAHLRIHDLLTMVVEASRRAG